MRLYKCLLNERAVNGIMIYEITEYKALESLITTSTNTAQEYMKHKEKTKRKNSLPNSLTIFCVFICSDEILKTIRPRKVILSYVKSVSVTNIGHLMWLY